MDRKVKQWKENEKKRAVSKLPHGFNKSGERGKVKRRGKREELREEETFFELLLLLRIFDRSFFYKVHLWKFNASS